MKSDKIIEEILGEIEKHEGVLSRRDAMKLLAASPIAAGVLAGTTTTTEAYASSDAKGKIVIVGGGLAGVATAAKLTNKLSNPDITIIEPNPHSVSYQPAYGKKAILRMIPPILFPKAQNGLKRWSSLSIRQITKSKHKAAWKLRTTIWSWQRVWCSTLLRLKA